MATINYKQKIKDYMNSSEVDTLYKSMLTNLFPELKESEDEMIRKWIIENIQETLDVDGFFEGQKTMAKNAIAWLEKQGEQKPVPKFKVGDFIVNDYCMGRVVEITNDAYLLDTEQGIPFSCHSTRLWDVTKDAKDGDVLACPNDAGDRDVVFVFKNINSDEGWVFCFCAIDANGCFCTNNDYVGNSNSTNISPATKEQRDTLERAMTNAGYSFDFENKELKKIEQSHVDLPNDEDYGIDGLYAAVDILKKTLGKVDGYQTDDGILEHKCAINAVKELSKQKPADTEKGAKGNDREIPNSEPPLTIKHAREVMGIKQDTAWSEEDEMFVHGLIRGLAAMKNIHGHTTFSSDNIDITKTIDWLKSLRERYTWKPSDEQIMALNYVVNLMASSERPTENDLYYNILKSLREQLKKLKE